VKDRLGSGISRRDPARKLAPFLTGEKQAICLPTTAK
jgi:hypothetical protein